MSDIFSYRDKKIYCHHSINQVPKRGETAGTASAACGFTDYSAFYRAYRARFGHSPKEDAKP